MGKIEKTGILAVQNLLSNSQIIIDYINYDDKYPIWDGDIHVYDRPNHDERKEYIPDRIPVQVKSERKRNHGKPTIKRQFSKVDLEKYLVDGGVLYIFSLFKNSVDYSIYVKFLLPINIRKLLVSGESATFERIDSIENFELQCRHFLKNRPHQIWLIENALPTFSSKEITIEASGIGNLKNIGESLSADDCYYYAVLDDSIKIPIDFIFKKAWNTRDCIVQVEEIKYFNSITKEFTEGNNVLQFNSSLEFNLIHEERKLTFTVKYTDDVLLEDFFTSIKFLQHVIKAGSFIIDGTEIDWKMLFSNILDDLNLDYIESLRDTLKLLRVDLNNITMKDVNESQEIINKLMALLLDGSPVSSKGSKDSIFFQNFQILNRSILVFFTRIEEDQYTAHHFCKDDFKENCTITNKEKGITIACSRFVAIYEFKEAFLNFIEAFDGYFPEIEADLIKFFDERLINPYNQIILAFIIGYDKTKKRGFLALASTILEFVNDNTKYLDSTIYLINKLQIKKRTEELTKEDKEILFNIKKSEQGSSSAILCANLILGYHAEFDHDFANLSKEEKIEFKSWPIWNLREKQA